MNKHSEKFFDFINELHNKDISLGSLIKLFTLNDPDIKLPNKLVGFKLKSDIEGGVKIILNLFAGASPPCLDMVAFKSSIELAILFSVYRFS